MDPQNRQTDRLAKIERCEVCDRVRAALAGADVKQDEGLAFDVAVLQAAWEEMHREAAATRWAVQAERERWLCWASAHRCCEAGLRAAPELCPWHDTPDEGGR